MDARALAHVVTEVLTDPRAAAGVDLEAPEELTHWLPSVLHVRTQHPVTYSYIRCVLLGLLRVPSPPCPCLPWSTQELWPYSSPSRGPSDPSGTKHGRGGT